MAAILQLKIVRKIVFHELALPFAAESKASNSKLL
jgi:hypothetical protein